MTLLFPAPEIDDRRRRFDCIDGTRMYLHPPDRAWAPRERDGMVLRHSPGRRLVRDDGYYNCVGLVFGARRGWLGDEVETDSLRTAVLSALRADGYVHLGSADTLRLGDVVVYGRSPERIDHVATVIGSEMPLTPEILVGAITTRVVSKFGEWGEYLHRIDDVPREDFGVPLSYWRQQFPTR